MAAIDLLKPYAGLRVLVTGGASGIGLAIADAFAECGGKVHVCDASGKALAALAQRPSRAALGTTLADVADAAAVERVFDDVTRTLGGLDVLVNNAGIAGPTGGIDEIDPAQWEQTVAVNLNAQFQFARRARCRCCATRRTAAQSSRCRRSRGVSAMRCARRTRPRNGPSSAS
ncbi:short chain dehydrogenase family protein [Burkholderia pseudomallei]|nr:short chain dehydrogenase family protein [Burkholderia pseudomallei]